METCVTWGSGRVFAAYRALVRRTLGHDALVAVILTTSPANGASIDAMLDGAVVCVHHAAGVAGGVPYPALSDPDTYALACAGAARIDREAVEESRRNHEQEDGHGHAG
jgi:hypothetical protein